MAVDFKHPEWTMHLDDWIMLRDVIRGNYEVKTIGRELYLPKPGGFAAQGTVGDKMYDAYLTRAQFPEIMEPTLTGMVGLVHQHEPQIELPSQLEYVREKATIDGLPLDVFHRRVTREILATGRFGIMTDVPEKGGEPYMVGYPAESIINWNYERNLFVLDENRLIQSPMDEFTLIPRPQWRVLRWDDAGGYSSQVYDKEYIAAAQMFPTPRGSGQGFDALPFVIAGPRDLDVSIDNPPSTSRRWSASFETSS